MKKNCIVQTIWCQRLSRSLPALSFALVAAVGQCQPVLADYYDFGNKPAADAGNLPAAGEPASGSGSGSDPASQPAATPPASDAAGQPKNPSWWKDGPDSDSKPATPADGGTGTATATSTTNTASSTSSATTISSPPARPLTPLTPAPPPAQKKLVLYGRIEELSGSGANLPFKFKLQAQKPIIDKTILPGSASTGVLQGRVSSFPPDWVGAYSGDIKIHYSQYDKIRWDFDPAEASKEQQLTRPGTVGKVTFNFDQHGNKVLVEPAQVLFTTTIGAAGGSATLNQMMGGAQGQMLQAMMGANAQAMMQNMPYMYVLHLGSVSHETGVTGNQLNSQVMKNDITQLKPNVLEECVVTWDNDRNPTTGKVRNSWSESVLRFTRLNSSQLYVQAATVKYRQDGKFENKILMYGTVTRGAAQTGMPSMQGFPMTMPGGGAGGAGGMPGLDQLLKQLQGN